MNKQTIIILSFELIFCAALLGFIKTSKIFKPTYSPATQVQILKIPHPYREIVISSEKLLQIESQKQQNLVRLLIIILSGGVFFKIMIFLGLKLWAPKKISGKTP